MKLVAVVTLAALALVAVAVARSADPKPRPRVEVTATLERINASLFGEARFYLLWNRTVRTRPIGHAVYSCRRVSGSSLCTALFALPLGKIVAVGELRRFDRYSMVVVGGTRCYAGAEPGVAGAWATEPGSSRILFSLSSTC